MAVEYFTCAETAKLVRQALKEAFSSMKFSVRSHRYSGGAAISISWIDGPSSIQVESIAALAYLDGGIDYQSPSLLILDGRRVQFGANLIICRREYSNEAIQAAIERVYHRLEGNFKQDGIEMPTVDAFRLGQLWSVQLSGYHLCSGSNVQTEICGAVSKHSFQLKTEKRTTADKVFVTHDDGYSCIDRSGIFALCIN